MKRTILAVCGTLILLGCTWVVLDSVVPAHPAIGPFSTPRLTSVERLRARLDSVQSSTSSLYPLDRPELTGSGIIQPQEDVAISTEVSGRVVALGADEGDEVEAGMLLVSLDEELLLAQIAQARAAVEAAEADLASVKAGARTPEIEAARAAVDSARAQVGVAQAAEDMARAGLRAAEANYRAAKAKFTRLAGSPTERELQISEQQLELSRIQLWAAQAQRDATKAGVHMPLSIPFTLGEVDVGPVVISNPVGPKQLDVETAEALILEANTAIRVSQLQYDRLAAGPSSEDLAALQAQVARAQADLRIAQVALERAQQGVTTAEVELEQAQTQLNLVLAGARQEDVALAQARVAQARAEVAILEVQQAKLSLHTPIAGIVTQRTVHAGEVVVAGARLFSISRLNPVRLTIYIPETQIGNVQIGQVADVSVDAYPDRVFRGEVVHIASQAEFTPRNIQTSEERATTVFAVRIKIPNPERLLKPGMPADARLHQ